MCCFLEFPVSYLFLNKVSHDRVINLFSLIVLPDSDVLSRTFFPLCFLHKVQEHIYQISSIEPVSQGRVGLLQFKGHLIQDLLIVLQGFEHSCLRVVQMEIVRDDLGKEQGVDSFKVFGFKPVLHGSFIVLLRLKEKGSGT